MCPTMLALCTDKCNITTRKNRGHKIQKQQQQQQQQEKQKNKKQKKKKKTKIKNKNKNKTKQNNETKTANKQLYRRLIIKLKKQKNHLVIISTFTNL